MDCLDIKNESSFQEQSSRSECTSPLDTTSNGGIADFRAKIINGQIKLKEKRGRSRVWNMFGTLVDENGDDIENFVACRSCFNTYKYVNSTSNLVKHKCYLNYEAKENGGMVDVDSETKSKLSDAAAQWVITNCRQLNIIEDSGLKNMARIFLSIGATFGENVNIENIMPTLSTVEGNIFELYELQVKNLAEKLSQIKGNSYSITSFVWSDSHTKRSFVSITLHYVQKSAMISHILSVSPLHIQHDSNAVNHSERAVKKCLRYFSCDLDEDRPIIVTDSDENFSTSFNNHNRIHCVVNLLNRTIEKVFREIPELQELLDTCIDNCHKPVESCSNSTRRNPILYHLNTALDKWSLYSIDICEMHRLQYFDIDCLVNVLQSFEQTSQALEDENMPTLHMIIPHLHKLRKLCADDNENSQITKTLKKALKLHLDSIATKYITIYHKIALFLFPPTKKLLLFNDTERKETIEECKKMMQQFYVEPGTTRKKLKIEIAYCGDGIFSDFVEKTTSDTKGDTINNEINEYLARNIALSEVFHVLEWWTANKVVFPLLYKVSCKILGTPASIAPSQRAMLLARNLLRANPTTVPCDDMINEIIFLNSNYNY